MNQAPTSPTPLEQYVDRVRPTLGRTAAHDLGVLDRLTVIRYALTIGSTDPIHLDSDAAHAAGHADVVAPPNLLAAVFEWGAGTPEERLGPDGTPDDHLLGDRDLALRGMGAGEEMELIAPAVAGMHLVVESTLESVEAKQTRSGPCVFVTESHTFRTPKGQVLNRNRRTVVLRNPVEVA